jgi:hypothetical protein
MPAGELVRRWQASCDDSNADFPRAATSRNVLITMVNIAPDVATTLVLGL